MKVTPLFVLLNLAFIGSICETAPTIPVKNNAGITNFHIAVPHNNGLECDACEFLTKELDEKLFHNDKLIALAQVELDNICNVLPASVHDLCLAAVNNTVPELLGKIGDYVENEGCQELGICKSLL